MSVGHEEVRLRGGDAGQQRLEVLRVHLEALLGRDRKVARMRLQEVMDPLRVVLAMLGVLGHERDLERFLQLPGGDERRQEVHLCGGEEVYRRQGPEDPFACLLYTSPSPRD